MRRRRHLHSRAKPARSPWRLPWAAEEPPLPRRVGLLVFLMPGALAAELAAPALARAVLGKAEPALRRPVEPGQVAPIREVAELAEIQALARPEQAESRNLAVAVTVAALQVEAASEALVLDAAPARRRRNASTARAPRWRLANAPSLVALNQLVIARSPSTAVVAGTTRSARLH